MPPGRWKPVFEKFEPGKKKNPVLESKGNKQIEKQANKMKGEISTRSKSVNFCLFGIYHFSSLSLAVFGVGEAEVSEHSSIESCGALF